MSELRIPADPLGEALHFLRMNGIFYCRCEFTAPWGLILPAFRDSLMFHIMTAGRCWLEVEGAEPRLLQPGDLALVPHGEGHRLASEQGEPGQKLFDLPHELISDSYEILRQGGPGAGTSLVCGVVRFDHPAARHLVDALPRIISVEAASASETEWLQSTVRFMAAEAQALRPGGETVITRLADILVIQAIRSWIAHDPAAQSGWLGALRDQQVGRALTLIHRDPARFNDLVGEPPIHYLTRWRMYMALALLKEEGAALHELAMRLGYQSEAAFSRAFKRYIGMSPGAARLASMPVSDG